MKRAEREVGLNWRKWMNLSVILCLGLVSLVQYQNCAPAPMNAVDGEIDSSPVGVINEVKSGQTISFAQKAVELHTQVQSIVLDGICPEGQQDAVLGWKITDSATRSEFARGYATCADGKFHVELAPTQELLCGREYTVAARLGFGTGGEVKLSRRCAPAGVSDGASMKAQLAVSDEARCVIERIEASASGCAAVCYDRSGVVQANRELDARVCGP